MNNITIDHHIPKVWGYLHKYAMIKACNYFADPLGDPHIICYDSETQRSARREATAARHGLKVGIRAKMV